VIEVESSEPFLRGEEQDLPVIAIETVRKQPDEQIRRETLAAEISRQLAAALASPAKPFSLTDLSDMNSKIRNISDSNTERRKALAAEVAQACNARWQRIQTNPELYAAIEAAAGNLFSQIRKFDGTPGTEELDILQLGMEEDEKKRTFLLYMMTSTWFLNPEGEGTWKLTDGGVVFFLNVLKNALADDSISEEMGQAGQTRV
jgi:hypothetical protein